MNTNEKLNTFFTKSGVKNYLPLYLELLDPSDYPRRGKSEVEFIKAAIAARQGDRRSYELEESAKRVYSSMIESFRVFKLIVSSCNLPHNDSTLCALQRALHEYLFRELYNADLNCRNLIEANIDYAKYEDINTYMEYLRKKYSISVDDFYYLSQEWFDQQETAYNALMNRDLNLHVYCDEQGVSFQILDKDLEPQFSANPVLCTDNMLIISKYYFALSIMSTFMHLALITRILSMEKHNSGSTPTIDIMDVNEIDTFTDVVKEFCNLES